MEYDPRNREHRRQLAEGIISTLEKAGFTEMKTDARTLERVYMYPLRNHPLISVRVYTGIVGDEVRQVGSDSIKVAVVYQPARRKSKGLRKAKRVYRTGQIEEIPQRMLSRMRECYRLASEAAQCTCDNCGAPMFLSKKGNLVCSDICWRNGRGKSSGYRA